MALDWHLSATDPGGLAMGSSQALVHVMFVPLYIIGHLFLRFSK